MDLPVNRFKQRCAAARADRPVARPGRSLRAELAANAGFDWLLLDGEHAPNDLRSLLGQLQALAPYPGQPVIRPVGRHRADQAIARHRRTDPAGTDGRQRRPGRRPGARRAHPPAGAGSAVRWPGLRAGTAWRNTWTTPTSRCACWSRWKTWRGLANLDAIAAVEGVDGVFIGPADLSAAMGHRGNPGHPEVQAAIEDAIRRIRAGQGRRHPLRRRGAGAALPGRAARSSRWADTSLLMRSLRELAPRRDGAVRQFLDLRLRGAPRSRCGRGARSALRQVSASVRGRMPSVGGTTVAARSPSGRRARSNPPAP